MNQLEVPAAGPVTQWLWDGLIARGNITLLTSQWKSGKTTLVTGLLQQCAAGSAGSFLNRTVAPARALVVSEEPRETWGDRLRLMPVGPHCRLMPRPFLRRPTPQQWDELVEHFVDLLTADQLDLLVIDSLARFLPGSTESDLSAILRTLDPLRRVTDGGAGVLILHHPRRRPSEEGCSARGSGGLLAAVDVIVEQSAAGKMQSEERRRKLFAVSRFADTPRRLFYDWDPTTGIFNSLEDPFATRFHDNWPYVLAILQQRKQAATHHELLMDWPANLEPPSATMLYNWLNRAYEEKLLRRKGSGRRSDPYRYRLENADDEYYDRGEMPPLPPFEDYLRERAP
jgi:hypothetical protein